MNRILGFSLLKKLVIPIRRQTERNLHHLYHGVMNRWLCSLINRYMWVVENDTTEQLIIDNSGIQASAF